jgi:hypothetical protein
LAIGFFDTLGRVPGGEVKPLRHFRFEGAVRRIGWGEGPLLGLDE